MLAFIEKNKYIYGINYPSMMERIITDEFIIKSVEIPVIFQQIFSKFNIFLDNKDIYNEFVKILEDNNFLEGNICEVGSGRYPRLAELVASKVQTKKGTLTIYDPKILFTDFKGIKIVKSIFTKDSNIDDIDTLYGLYPCGSAITIAEKAFEEDKNLVLAFCRCNHSTKEHRRWLGKYWAEDFCMDYRKKYGDEAEIIHWPSQLDNDRPIMIRRSSKQKLKTK